MATLSAYLPAADAVGVYAVLDEHARRAGFPGDERSMDARRGDALVDLVLNPTGYASEHTSTTAHPSTEEPDYRPQHTSASTSSSASGPSTSSAAGNSSGASTSSTSSISSGAGTSGSSGAAGASRGAEEDVPVREHHRPGGLPV